MRLRRAARLSLRALLAHRLRTALALTSVAMGVAGVLLTRAIGKGAEAEVQRSIDSAGSNLIVVRPAPVKRTAARRKIRGSVTTLRMEDYAAIADLPLTLEAAPGLDGGVRAKANSGSMSAGVLGSGPGIVRLRNLRLASGRLFDEEDDAARRRVAVLGFRVARTLFPDEDPLGRDVRLRGLPFEVIGVLEPKGLQADGSDQDGNVFIPIRTALRRVFNTTWLSTVYVSVIDREHVDDAAEAMRGLLRERHRTKAGAPDDFQVQDQIRLLAMQQSTVRSLTFLTAGLAAVALLVGDAGIFALMYLSVKERTAEIGLRMAVGARATCSCSSWAKRRCSRSGDGPWARGPRPWVPSGSRSRRSGRSRSLRAPPSPRSPMALATGLGFGAFPARKAAQLPPIRALGMSV